MPERSFLIWQLLVSARFGAAKLPAESFGFRPEVFTAKPKGLCRSPFGRRGAEKNERTKLFRLVRIYYRLPMQKPQERGTEKSKRKKKAAARKKLVTAFFWVQNLILFLVNAAAFCGTAQKYAAVLAHQTLRRRFSKPFCKNTKHCRAAAGQLCAERSETFELFN